MVAGHVKKILPFVMTDLQVFFLLKVHWVINKTFFKKCTGCYTQLMNYCMQHLKLRMY